MPLTDILREVQRGVLDGGCDQVVSIAGDERLSAQDRLGIYVDAYHARCAEALATDFGALRAYLGEAAFALLVRRYCAAYPSRGWSLRWLGQNLCAFLQESACYARRPELLELARFEWALCHAFDAADGDIVDAAALSAIAPSAWAELALEFHASAQVIALRGNIPELWRALNAQQPSPALQWLDEPASWLIWRRELKVLFRRLDAVEAVALTAFQRGDVFADVCERLSGALDEEQIPARAANGLHQWLAEGLVVRFSC